MNNANVIKEATRIAKCRGARLTADDKTAVEALLSVYARYIEARGSLPSIGVTNNGRVSFTATDGTLAQFSGYNVAQSAVVAVEHAVADRVKQLACDSI